MKVKEWLNGALILDGDIDKGIDEAFVEERYVEAFALLHGQIDWLMTSLYQLQIVMREHSTSENAWDLIENKKYSYIGTMSYLHNNGIINDDECHRLRDFNAVRNKIIHRLIRRSHQTRKDPRTKVTRQEAIDGFKEGKALASLLRQRSGMLNPFPATTPEEAPE